MKVVVRREPGGGTHYGTGDETVLQRAIEHEVRRCLPGGHDMLPAPGSEIVVPNGGPVGSIVDYWPDDDCLYVYYWRLA